MMENQASKRVKILRTDNGLKYLNCRFNSFYSREGIVRHKTVARTPQHNGFAERINRTLLGRVRCMLFTTNLQKNYWAKVVTTTAYFINRSPLVAIDYKTSEEVWIKHPPNLEHLKCLDV